MNKLTAIKIKYNDGRYSDEIPVGVLAENVKWNNNNNLTEVLGNVKIATAGTVQDQIDALVNEKADMSDVTSLGTRVTNVEVEINGIASGTPPTADSTSEMDPNESTVYINTTDGKWYYWDGTAFQPGGTYGGAVTSTTFTEHGVPADDFAVGQAFGALGDRVTAVEGEIPDISVVDGRLVIDGTSYEIGGVGIASITKTGTAGLVDTYTILMTDGTSTTFTVTNGDASDAKIQGFIEGWLEEHPEATTTVQDGAITLSKLSSEVTQKLSDVKLNYRWCAAGYMRTNVRTFQGWTHNVVWEPDLGKAVGIVISSNAAHEYAKPWYRVTIDPSGYMSEYEAVTLYDTDGTTEYTSTAYYMGSLCRLSDGRYIAIDSGHDIYISSDYCQTFVRQQTYAFDGTGSMFGLRQLSNGRLIVGFGGNRNGFYYSDDVGETWTATSADNSGLGQQAYPSGAFKPFEPCFIDCGNGKVACFARKSTSAYTSGGTLAESVYKHLEPAVYSVSTDYGATWSAWVDSQTIIDMTASNAKVCIIDGTVHMVFTSRLTHADGNLRVFYTYASIEDAYADNWATPVMIDVGHWNESTAANSHDGGYPSVWTDGIGNLFAVYYDGDGSGTAAGANWRLCIGAPVVKKPAVSDGSGAFNVSYPQKAVDLKIASIMTKINELYMLIGELPPAPDSYDGSSLVTDGLEAFFDMTSQSKWDGSLITSMVGELTARSKGSTPGGVIGSSNMAPTAFNNGFANIGSLYFTKTIAEIVGSSVTAFTVEYICYITGNSTTFFTKTTTVVNTSNANNPNVYSGKSGNALFSSVSVPHHVCAVFESGKVTWYVNGTKKVTETTQVAFADILASYPLPNAHQTTSGSALGDVRFYSKALSDDEIRNNFLYTQAKVDYTQAPVFTTS